MQVTLTIVRHVSMVDILKAPVASNSRPHAVGAKLATNCLECESGFLENNACVGCDGNCLNVQVQKARITYRDKQILITGSCYTCHTSCSKCDTGDYNICSECPNAAQIIANTGECVLCADECKTCRGTAQTCTSCVDGKVL